MTRLLITQPPIQNVVKQPLTLQLDAEMADKVPNPKEPDAPFATRIDPTKDVLTNEQMHFIRQVEMEQWKKRTQRLRSRNVVTALAIGAVVMGICILVKSTDTHTHTQGELCNVNPCLAS